MVSDDWSTDDFGDGESFPCCVIEWCEHNIDLSECETCRNKRPIRLQKEKTKFEKYFEKFLFPFYVIGWLITGIFVGIRFFFEEGYESLVGFLILGWVVSAIYHFFFTFLPFLVNLVL
tara:strand:- start:182 stop:535 length:354 start_codon:yes stop_codon:yes gene_type:complete